MNEQQWAQRDRYKTVEAYYGGAEIQWQESVAGVAELWSARGWHVVSVAPLRTSPGGGGIVDTYLLTLRLPMGVEKQR